MDPRKRMIVFLIFLPFSVINSARRLVWSKQEWTSADILSQNISAVSLNPFNREHLFFKDQPVFQTQTNFIRQLVELIDLDASREN